MVRPLVESMKSRMVMVMVASAPVGAMRTQGSLSARLGWGLSDGLVFFLGRGDSRGMSTGNNADTLPTESTLPRGWVCGLCSASYSPAVVECHRCNASIPVLPVEVATVVWRRYHPAVTRVTLRPCEDRGMGYVEARE